MPYGIVTSFAEPIGHGIATSFAFGGGSFESSARGAGAMLVVTTDAGGIGVALGFVRRAEPRRESEPIIATNKTSITSQVIATLSREGCFCGARFGAKNSARALGGSSVSNSGLNLGVGIFCIRCAFRVYGLFVSSFNDNVKQDASSG
jgi:hypothetical protein